MSQGINRKGKKMMAREEEEKKGMGVGGGLWGWRGLIWCESSRLPCLVWMAGSTD